MKKTHVAVSACAALLATAFTLVSNPAEAASDPFVRGGDDYPYYKEKGKFGGGLTVGAHYETFDYREVCDWLPTEKEAPAACDAKLSKLGLPTTGLFKTGCVMAYESQRKEYCGKVGRSLEASANAVVTAKLFDEKVDILELEGFARADRTSAWAGYTISAVGKVLVNFVMPARLEAKPTYSQRIFKASAGVGVGPLSVSVSAEAVGSFGVKIGAEAGTAGVRFDGTPFTNLDVTAGASVGKVVAEAGVEGTINLMDLKLPSEVSAVFEDAKTIHWTGRSDLTFDALYGSIDLYGKIMGKRVGSITLFEWDGIRQKKVEVWNDEGVVRL